MAGPTYVSIEAYREKIAVLDQQYDSRMPVLLRVLRENSFVGLCTDANGRAKALGQDVPPTLLARADEVIE